MAGTLTISTLSDGTNSTSATNCIQGSAKAWVRFYGIGTATNNASYNISSVTRNSSGNYTINFTNAMVDTNYSVGGTVGYNDASSSGNLSPKTFNTTSLRFITQYANGSFNDYDYISVQIWR
jgi:hypothetical protein